MRKGSVSKKQTLCLKPLRCGSCLLLRRNMDFRFQQTEWGTGEPFPPPGWLCRNHCRGSSHTFLNSFTAPPPAPTPAAIYLLISKLLAILWPLAKKHNFISWCFVIAVVFVAIAKYKGGESSRCTITRWSLFYCFTASAVNHLCDPWTRQ